jgi:GTPase SAR1 family protein
MKLKLTHLPFLLLFFYSCSEVKETEELTPIIKPAEVKQEVVKPQISIIDTSQFVELKNYFTKNHQNYRPDIDLKGNLEFFDSEFYVYDYTDTALLNNIDSLMLKVSFKEQLNVEDANYNVFKCLKKESKIKKWNIKNFGKVQVYEYKNQFEAGCGEHNKYLLINESKKQFVIAIAHDLKILSNGNIKFIFSCRGKISEPYILTYDKKLESFLVLNF